LQEEIRHCCNDQGYQQKTENGPTAVGLWRDRNIRRRAAEAVVNRIDLTGRFHNLYVHGSARNRRRRQEGLHTNSQVFAGHRRLIRGYLNLVRLRSERLRELREMFVDKVK